MAAPINPNTTTNPVPIITVPLINPNTGNTNLQWWRFWASIPKAIYNVLFSTNGIVNPTQTALNLVAGPNVTLTADQVGDVVIAAATTGTPLRLETNGTPNGSQTLLNLKAGSNVTVTDDGVGDVVIAAASDSIGGANVQTGNYTLVAGDSGKAVVHNSATAHTFTLPAAPPSAKWCAFIANIGLGQLTVSPNGLNVDGIAPAALTLFLNFCQGIYITTDGTNYLTSRGPVAGSLIQGDPSVLSNSFTGVSVPYLLTISDTHTGNGSTLGALQLLSSSNQANILRITSAAGGFSGTALLITSLSGNGIVVTGTGGAGAGDLLVLNAGGNQRCINAATNGIRPCAVLSNTATGSSQAGALTITSGYSALAQHTLAQITAWSAAPNGAQAYATDAKNFSDDLAAVGSVAVGSGSGTGVMKVNGSWRTLA